IRLRPRPWREGRNAQRPDELTFPNQRRGDERADLDLVHRRTLFVRDQGCGPCVLDHDWLTPPEGGPDPRKGGEIVATDHAGRVASHKVALDLQVSLLLVDLDVIGAIDL